MLNADYHVISLHSGMYRMTLNMVCPKINIHKQTDKNDSMTWCNYEIYLGRSKRSSMYMYNGSNYNCTKTMSFWQTTWITCRNISLSCQKESLGK